MMANHVKGNNGLADALGVNVRSIVKWKSQGVLDDAIVADFRRTIIYDINKVFEILRNRKTKSGRPKGS